MTTPPDYTRLTEKNFSVNTASDLGICLGRSRLLNEGQYILPTAVAWPYVNDANGQPYPAGLVAVRQMYHPSFAPYTNSRADLIPVPSVLPAGYTHRWARAHNLFPGQASPQFGQAIFQPGFSPLPPTHTTGSSHRLRLANGRMHDYYYTPECQGDDAYSAKISSSSWGSVASAGLRYIQWKGVFAGITMQLRCNANGSSTGTGDTLLAAFTGPGDSAVITAGLQFPLGEKRMLYFRTIGAPPDGITLQVGPRCDIPLPWTATGLGLIAPGGYVAAALDVRLPT